MLLRVSDCLNTVELGHFRRTCKFVEQILFDGFAKEFFSKRQFMLEEHSLQCLVDIAHHPSLSTFLTYVIISAESIGDPELREIQEENGGMSSDTFVWTGRAKDMLVEAFKKLPNLQTVSVRAQSGPPRSRDGPDSRWRSYGWSLGTERLNARSMHHIQRHTGLRRDGKESATFALVVIALAEAHVNPEAIEVFTYVGRGLDRASFNVLNGRSGPQVWEMLEKLKRLLLTVASVSNPHHLTPIRRFLRAAVNVESLRLNMVNNQEEDALLTWLSSSPHQVPASPPERVIAQGTLHGTALHPSLAARRATGDMSGPQPRVVHSFEKFPASPPFAHLRKLDIGFARITHGVLLRLLTRLQLHELSLWKLVLMIDPQTATHENAQQAWPKLLRDFGNSEQNLLRTIMIGEVVAGPMNRGPTDIELYLAVRWPLEGSPVISEPLPLTAPSLKRIEYRAQSGRCAGEWLVEAADRIDQVVQPKVCNTTGDRWMEVDPDQLLRFRQMVDDANTDDDEHDEFDDDDELDESDGDESESNSD
jgi:hypothetical protein